MTKLPSRDWVHAVILLPFLFTSVLAQGSDIGAMCPSTTPRFFPAHADSVQHAHRLARAEALVARVRHDISHPSRPEALQALDSLRAAIDAMFGEAPTPVGVRVRWASVILLPRDQPAEIITAERALLADLARLYPCDTRLGNEISADLTHNLVRAEEYAEARGLAARNLSRLHAAREIDSATLIIQERVLGLACQGMRVHDTALVHFRSAMASAEARNDSVAIMGILREMAPSSMALGQFDETEEILRRRLALSRAMYHPASEPVIAAMNGLVDFYHLTSQRGKAERLARETLVQLSASSRLVAGNAPRFRPAEVVTPATEHSLWINCAMILMENRRDEEAMQCIERSREAAARIPSELVRHLTIGLSDVTIGKWEQNLARYDRAMQHFQRAKRQIDSIPDPTYVRAYAAPIHALEATLLIDGFAEYAKADSLFASAVPVFEEFYGPDAMQLLMPLSTWARACAQIGDAARAGTLIARAEEIARTLLPETHFLCGRVRAIAAECALAAGENSRAATLGREAVRILSPLYDQRHHVLLDALHIQAQCLDAQADSRETAAAMRLLMDATVARVRDAFAFEGEEQQVRVHHLLGMRHLSTIARWARRGDSGPEAPEILMNAMLALKGAVLSENIRLGQLLRLRGSEQQLLDTLQDLRAQSAALATRDLNAESMDVTAQRRERLRAAIDSLDGRLRRLHGGYHDRRETEDADWRGLQRTLESDEAVVDYLAFDDATGAGRQRDPSPTRRVLAVVLRASGSPVVVDLCAESAIELAAGAGRMARSVSLRPHADGMRALHRLVVAPLVPTLEGVHKVTIIPDGILHRVPFASLIATNTDEEIQYYDDQMILRQQVSGRDVLSSRRRFLAPTSRGEEQVVLIGNPSFAPASSGAASYELRGWKDLPGTARELDALAAVCAEAGISTLRIDRAAANEQAIKALSGNAPRVLHLATHGYFYPVHASRLPQSTARPESSAPAVQDGGTGTEQSPGTVVQRGDRGRESIAASGHPLLRSGLILAGANAVWKGRPIDDSADDGVLTAMEVGQLDLSGTELVVLSACETALGDISTGEGVFGLQRAFLSAGVSTLLMSLWKVDDAATAEFMVEFYRSWLRGASKHDALRAARQRIRARYPDPEIWAAFVLVGE